MPHAESKTTTEVAVTVKLVGVIGCSASGKSTAAHLLASRLNSPLHPISTDSFFDPACEALGTYEDHRCIDYARVVRWMSALTSAVPVVRVPATLAVTDTAESAVAWQKEVQRVWWSAMRVCLPEAETYYREELVDKEIGSSTAAAPADTDDAADDASLGAHEAEDAERRAQLISATPPPPSPALAALSSGDAVPRLTVYIVWEGFTLLCSRHVNARVDVAVHVECDGETACLRRFFRSPRRHLVQHAVQSTTNGVDAAVVSRIVRQVYRTRIEQVWATRAEAWRRASLYDAVTQELREEGLLTDDTVGVSGIAATDNDVADTVRAALSLMSAEAFCPPRPQEMRGWLTASSPDATHEKARCPHDDRAGVSELSASAVSSRVCWTPAGVPTRVFQQFWEADFDRWLSESAPRGQAPSALCFASLTHRPCGAPAKKGAAAAAVDKTGPPRDTPNHGDTQTDADDGEDGAAYVRRVLGVRGWAALLHRRGADDTTEAAAALLAQLGHTAAEAGPRVAAALAPYYYEFRYWFFFEVLYYAHILAPLQLHRLRWRSVPDAGAAEGTTSSQGCASRSVPRPCWTLYNGREVHGKDSEALLTQVDAVVAAIMGCA